MGKYYGVIGYVETVETSPGVWTEQITEHKYSGDMLPNIRSLQSADQLNDNLDIANKLSIIADPYTRNNFHSMRYVEFMGARWKISRVEVQYPRLILTLGGLYNG